jgi:hypothetical protein
MALERETEVFNEHRAEWCKEHTGKFAVIQDDTILHPFFHEWEAGLRAGIKSFDLNRPFLVKEILETDRVYFIGGHNL